VKSDEISSNCVDCTSNCADCTSNLLQPSCVTGQNQFLNMIPSVMSKGHVCNMLTGTCARCLCWKVVHFNPIMSNPHQHMEACCEQVCCSRTSHDIHCLLCWVFHVVFKSKIERPLSLSWVRACTHMLLTAHWLSVHVNLCDSDQLCE